MDEKLIVQRTEHFDESLITPYLSMLGSLLWIARYTRPGIYYSVIYLAQFSSCPSEQSWTALQRRGMSILHMLIEMFGTIIRIAQQQVLTAAPMATATTTPPTDHTWQQRATRFFEEHALGYGQIGPSSPLQFSDSGESTSQQPGTVQPYVLPHADVVPPSGTGYEDGPAAYHATRSGRCITAVHL
ncbi:hypothetical protein CYMTET_14660 [Cymbomonas tetramitiformis]|uniref:Uncharacterized protein n=1 Tax=Cymbomonas tetramitiformis TaxID=36881 RepID=A0AAE0L9Y5_9CHLO|nr:hypothetical protein CYMTET_14660 [Cymbomonas tetramitiformis]